MMQGTTYDYAGQDPINSYDLSGLMPLFDNGPKQKLITGSQCGAFGFDSCKGLEGDASDPLFSTGNVVLPIGLSALPGADEVLLGGRVAAAAGRATAAAKASRAAGVASTVREMVVSAHETAEAAGAEAPSWATWKLRGVGATKAFVDRVTTLGIQGIRNRFGFPPKGPGNWPGFWPPR